MRFLESITQRKHRAHDYQDKHEAIKTRLI